MGYQEQKAFPKPNRVGQDGMELRDYFAAKALQGLLAHRSATRVVSATDYSNKAYALANAMMSVRLK